MLTNVCIHPALVNQFASGPSLVATSRSCECFQLDMIKLDGLKSDTELLTLSRVL